MNDLDKKLAKVSSEKEAKRLKQEKMYADMIGNTEEDRGQKAFKESKGDIFDEADCETGG